mmetsp:Transcript_10374/g.26696  ORF Transcript_10374/g.26696 Transcript_10374/m.26696 type:complete len:386 (-) Transcript_10374:1563-2720(-)
MSMVAAVRGRRQPAVRVVMAVHPLAPTPGHHRRGGALRRHRLRRRGGGRCPWHGLRLRRALQPRGVRVGGRLRRAVTAAAGGALLPQRDQHARDLRHALQLCPLHGRHAQGTRGLVHASKVKGPCLGHERQDPGDGGGAARDDGGAEQGGAVRGLQRPQRRLQRERLQRALQRAVHGLWPPAAGGKARKCERGGHREAGARDGVQQRRELPQQLELRVGGHSFAPRAQLAHLGRDERAVREQQRGGRADQERLRRVQQRLHPRLPKARLVGHPGGQQRHVGRLVQHLHRLHLQLEKLLVDARHQAHPRLPQAGAPQAHHAVRHGEALHVVDGGADPMRRRRRRGHHRPGGRHDGGAREDGRRGVDAPREASARGNAGGIAGRQVA